MNKKGTTLAELLAAMGILATMAVTIAAMSGMVANSSASVDKNGFAMSQANVALETVVEGVKNSPPMPDSVPKTVAKRLTCTNFPNPGGGCMMGSQDCDKYIHQYCTDKIFDMTEYTKSMCFKITSGGSGVQYLTADGKTMQAVFQKDSDVIHAPDLSKYSASDSGTYQVLASNVDKLAFSASADARLVMKIALLKPEASKASSGKALSGAANSGSVDGSTDGSEVSTDTTQNDVQTSVLPDLAEGVTTAEAQVN